MRHNLRTVLWLLALAVVFLALDRAVGAPGDAATKTTLTLAWDPNDPGEEITGYRLYTRTNIAVGTWAVLTNVTGGATTNVTVSLAALPGWPVYRGPHFFMLTATNWIGESDPSNVVSIPKLPSSGGGFRIKAVQ